MSMQEDIHSGWISMPPASHGKKISNNYTEQAILDVAKCSALSDVSSLDLSDRKLAKLDPTVFSKLVALESLNLSHNLIADLPYNFGLKKLKVLDISHNHLKSVKTLLQFSNLEKLDIRYTQVSAAEHCIVILMLPKLKTLNGKDFSVHKVAQSVGDSLTAMVKEAWNKEYAEELKDGLSAAEMTILRENLFQLLSSQIRLQSAEHGPLVDCTKYMLTILREIHSEDQTSTFSTPLIEKISFPIDYNGLIVIKNESGDVIEQVVDCEDGSTIVLKRKEGSSSKGRLESPESSHQMEIPAADKNSLVETLPSSSGATDPCLSSQLTMKDDKQTQNFKHEVCTAKVQGLKPHLKPVGVIVHRITLNKRNEGEKCFQPPNNELPSSKFESKSTLQDVPPPEQEMYKCQFCDMSYKSKEVYERHTARHTGDKPFECLICQKSFTTRECYKNHVTIHTGEKPFKCQFCEESFRIRATWQLHVSKHLGEKPFKCTFCNKAFTLQRVCNAHERVHTGERKFKCRFCDMDFRFESSLKTHERKHTGEKPFKCQYCVKSFSAKHQRSRHEMLHTGEKPFKCPFCDKSFRSKDNCFMHQGTHAGNLSFFCQLCHKLFTTKEAFVAHETSCTPVTPTTGKG